MTRQVAVDYIEHGVIVNAVAPGRILTGRLGSRTRPTYDDGGELPADELEELLASEARTPHSRLGRLGVPTDVAKAAVFLASDYASFIVGETLFVDGGYMAC